jgi:hypothetical protein
VKNQYFADVNDYRKYGLLRCMSHSGLRIGVCWMLTAPDGRTDGGKTQYLQQPLMWRHRDADLFDFLKEAVVGGNRDVRQLEASGLLSGAEFHAQVLTDNGVHRAQYFARALDTLGSADVLFFDPDTGLEVSSVAYGRAESSRYLYWREVDAAAQSGKTLVLFQHWKRENRVEMAARLSRELQRRMPTGRR